MLNKNHPEERIMTNKHYFDEKLSQRGKAEEDLWFARRDRELLDAQRQKPPAEEAECPNSPAEDSGRPS